MKTTFNLTSIFLLLLSFSCQSSHNNKDKTGIEAKPKQYIPMDNQRSGTAIDSIDSLYPDHSTEIKFHSEWTKQHYKQRIASFKNAPLSYGDIVFVGNSITEQGGDWSAKLNKTNVRNRGISGDVTDGVLQRLNEITHYKPKILFLLIGINDLFNLHYEKEIPSSAYVANNIIKITELVHEKSPETKIYVQTILPTSETYMIDHINQVNSIIKNHEKNSNYEIVDLFSVFVDVNGLIRPELTSDGTHLNKLGYTLWVETISPNKYKDKMYRGIIESYSILQKI